MKAILAQVRLSGKTVTKKVSVIDAPEKESDNLDFYYNHLNCHTIDVVYTDEGDYFVDDNGLFAQNNPVFDYGNGVVIAGSILATNGVDSKGRTLFFDPSIDADFDKMMVIIDKLEKAELKGVTNG